MKQQLIARPEFFFTTAPLPCPYLAGRLERRLMTELTGRQSEALHDSLSRAGFRRSHGIAYTPICSDCSACIPVRIVANEFVPKASFKRVLKRNRDITGHVVPAIATEEQYALFSHYQRARHGDGDMATMDFQDYRMLVEESPIETFLIEFRDAHGVLVGACLTDRISDGLSAVYSFFDTDLSQRSLGSFMVMWLIDRVLREGSRFVYLGYWIAATRKMSYKTRFQPLEIYRDGRWQRLSETRIAELAAE